MKFIKTENGTLSINPRPVTVTADDKTKVFVKAGKEPPKVQIVEE